ncbi:MAG: hypothetical protein Q7U47_02000 [Paludibacter sp.]|nr:hypothetical protein [Paludibacter sp.]
MRNYILLSILFFLLVSCNNTNSDKDRQEIDSLKTEIKLLKAKIKADSVLNSKDNEYLYGVPPAPPYREIKLTLETQILEGCTRTPKTIIGYIISVYKTENEPNNFILQDEYGVQEQFDLDGGMSEAQKSWLPHLLIPGNKVKIIVQRCGSGGIPILMYIESIKR